jgi:hypothetical protein
MTERNPQEDPRRGDVVVCMGGKYRRVVQRVGNDIDYHQGQHYGEEGQTESVKLKTCWISTWQEWCRKADVREVRCGMQ